MNRINGKLVFDCLDMLTTLLILGAILALGVYIYFQFYSEPVVSEVSADILYAGCMEKRENCTEAKTALIKRAECLLIVAKTPTEPFFECAKEYRIFLERFFRLEISQEEISDEDVVLFVTELNKMLVEYRTQTENTLSE